MNYRPSFNPPTVLGWTDASTVAGLAACTAMWLRGNLPDHPRRAVIDPEMNDRKALLIRLNEAGILTTRSQNGLAKADGYQQRAAVEMRFCEYGDVDLAPVLAAVLEDFPEVLVSQSHIDDSRLRAFARLAPGLPVRRMIDAPGTAISAAPARRYEPEANTEILASWGAGLHVSQDRWPGWPKWRSKREFEDTPIVVVASTHWGAADGGLWKMLDQFLDRLAGERRKYKDKKNFRY